MFEANCALSSGGALARYGVEQSPSAITELGLEVSRIGQRGRECGSPVGLNAYGFAIQGAQPFTLRVGYVYAGVYASSERNKKNFGSPGEIRLDGNRTREDVTSVREIKGVLGGWDARGQGLGGLTLGVHHVYDPSGHSHSFRTIDDEIAKAVCLRHTCC